MKQIIYLRSKSAWNQQTSWIQKHPKAQTFLAFLLTAAEMKLHESQNTQPNKCWVLEKYGRKSVLYGIT